MKHEKPISIKDEDGNKIPNPNEIIVNQHVIPRVHILEWSEDDRMVKVHELDSAKTKPLAASSNYFCVMRLWDQWAETEMLGSNENNYNQQLRLFKEGKSFTEIEHVMAYYSMLCVRCLVASEERPNFKSEFESLSYEPTKAELEENEKQMKGSVHYIQMNTDEGSQHIERILVREKMQMYFRHWCSSLVGQEWHVVAGGDTSFVLPDALHKNILRGCHILPISPEHVLIANSTYSALEEAGSLNPSFINEMLLQSSEKYYIFK